MDRLKELIHEIHRRSLWQVLGVYVLGSWLVLQVVDTLSTVLQLPNWFPSFALALLIVGLPLVVATAFVQEGISSGAGGAEAAAEASRQSEGGSESPTGAARSSIASLFTWRRVLTGGVLAFALWGAVAGGWLILGEASGLTGGSVGSSDPGLAVLPFENRSELSSDAHFTDGMHDELLTKLAKISSLRVISRTSVMGYRETEKNIREIGEELGVEYVLEGGLLRAGDQVRLNVQLIHAAGDERHVWAETYDRRMTVENLLAIQSEIAQNVVRELRTVLSPEEEASIGSVPTANVDAYDFYLRGNDWLGRGGLSEEEYRLAAQQYERAIELDPAFGLAYGKLAEAHVRLYFQGHDRSASRVAAARAAIERAVELAPDDPEVRKSLGDYWYYAERDYDRALEEYGKALQGLPNSGAVLEAVAWVQRRKGDWEASLARMEAGRAVNPRSPRVLLNYAASLRQMRRYREAMETFDEAVSFNPDVAVLWQLRSLALVAERGDFDAARASWDGAPQSVLDNPRSRFYRIQLELMARNYERALDLLGRETEEAFDTQISWVPVTLLRATAHEGEGNASRARAAYDSARVLLEGTAIARPDDERVHGALGYALAGLGRKDEAIAAARRGVELLPISRDAYWGTDRLENLASVYAQVGEADAAVDLLEELLSIPSSTSVALLRVDPAYDLIRDDRRFQALLERYDEAGASGS